MVDLLPLAFLASRLAASDNSAPAGTTAREAVYESDQNKLQGTWVLSALECDPELGDGGAWYEAFKDEKITITGNKLRFSLATASGSFVLKQTASLPVITWTSDDGKSRWSFLYELRGATLRLCCSLGPSNCTLPTALNSKNQGIIFTYRRK
jgi:uncharacterized protein (TIGR03067 family)